MSYKDIMMVYDLKLIVKFKLNRFDMCNWNWGCLLLCVVLYENLVVFLKDI